MAGTAAAATIVTSTHVRADTHEHEHHNHADHGYMPPDGVDQALIDGAVGCQKAGQACIEHCIQLIKGGDMSVAGCLDRTQEMLVMCTAMARMVSYQSPHTRKLVKVCIDVCNDCMKSCEIHAAKHVECRACADSCKDCINAAKAYLAA